MINKQVVFILGAGASKPYGFPLGSELVKQAYNILENQQILDCLETLDFAHDDIKKFRKELLSSARQSIDAFLEHRQELIELGKFVIAATLIPREQEKSLINFDNSDHWYKYIFNKMNSTFEDFDKNQIKFITFNYDRSLEHFLLTSLKSSYGKSEAECAEKIKRIPIVHLHGQLGHLPWQDMSDSREYNDEINSKTLRQCADMIRIIHEDVSGNEEFQLAWKALEEAEKIYFLGFGYHEANMIRLKIQEYLPGREVVGSAIGMTRNEIIIIEKRYTGFERYYRLVIGKKNILVSVEVTTLGRDFKWAPRCLRTSRFIRGWLIAGCVETQGGSNYRRE